MDWKTKLDRKEWKPGAKVIFIGCVPDEDVTEYEEGKIYTLKDNYHYNPDNGRQYWSTEEINTGLIQDEEAELV